MNDTPKKTRKSSPKSSRKDEPGPSKPLLRSNDERMVWGVAGGLAEHLGVDVTLVRIGFVIAALFGVGILAYLVLAVALPQDDGTGKPADESLSSRFGRVFLVVLLVAIGICVACGLAMVSAWTAATGHGTVIAAIVICLGALIAAVAFVSDGRGDLRRKAAPWLIGAALLLALPAGAVAAADIEIDESIGEREYTPTTVADIRESGYELGTGQLTVDLRNLPWKDGETIPVEADLGFGQMIVTVPPEVCVKAHATAKAGDLVIAGDRSDGWHADVDQGSPTTDAPTLELDASVQFGQIVVTDLDPAVFERHHGPDNDYDHNNEMEVAQERACGR